MDMSDDFVSDRLSADSLPINPKSIRGTLRTQPFSSVVNSLGVQRGIQKLKPTSYPKQKLRFHVVLSTLSDLIGQKSEVI